MEIKITINDKLVRIFRNICTKKNSVFIIAVILFCAGLVLFSQQVVELDTFHDGDVIYAGPINDNFRALKERELGSLGDVDVSGAESGQYLQYVTGIWVASNGGVVDGDDLGNHTAISNINLSGNYLSGDGDSEGIFVDTIGNVGIGTMDPDVKLNVIGGDGADTRVKIGVDDVDGRLMFRWDDTTNVAYINSYAAGYEKLELQGSTVAINTDTGGNVGIGTTDPGYKLDVAGDINFTGTLRQNGSPVSFGSLWTDQGAYINANNATDVVVTDTGRVGIGTTDPPYSLTIFLSGYTDGFCIYSSDGGSEPLFRVREGSDTSCDVYVYGIDGATGVSLYGGGINLMRGNNGTPGLIGNIQGKEENGTNPADISINAEGGNVGIGTTDLEAGTKLTIFGTNENVVIKDSLGNSSDSTAAAPSLYGKASDNTNLWKYGSDQGTNDDVILLNFRNGSLKFGTNATEYMRINNTGNVGIGITSPGAALHIDRSPMADIYLTEEERGACISGQLDGISGGLLRFWTHNSSGTLTERMNIDEDGNVGIGITGPNYKLDVDGDINCSGDFYNSGTPVADYVFDDDYTVLSIEEHAQVMWENKHLPKVAGQDDLGDKPYSMSERREQILEELEIVHIYIEQLYNEIKDLKSEIAELKAK